MKMETIGLPRVRRGPQTGFSLSPEAVARLSQDREAEVLVEHGAAAAAGYSDADWALAGAEIVDGRRAWSAQVVLYPGLPSAEEIRLNLGREGLIGHGRLELQQIFVSGPVPASSELRDAISDAEVTAFATANLDELLQRLSGGPAGRFDPSADEILASALIAQKGVPA